MMEEMKQTLLLTMELHETRLRAEEDVKSRDDQIRHLKELLSAAVRERDEAQRTCKKIVFENLLLRRRLLKQSPDSGISSVEDDHPRRGIDSANASDCDESIASSPQRMPAAAAELPTGMIKGPLPERGKLLQAVVGAGPLLQTLLLAGPLPQWRHPPPPVDPYEIPPPPVVMPPSPPYYVGGKRGVPEGFEWSKELKHPRISRTINSLH